jgi:cyanophycinase-like exopeptidase
MKYSFVLFLYHLLFGFEVYCQSYTSYLTGNNADLQTIPSGGVCLMGGATEDDNAMIWFLQRANGGDVLVLRASGSDGYNDYMYSQLGVNLNSVETIVFNSSTAASEPYIHQKIKQAEAIWFAGGDQWDYISYWRNNEVDSLINNAISNRHIVIGGTSAGMAIQGGFYFSAQNGTVTSSTTLSNPYDNNVTVDSLSFISNEFLHDVITDTHYDDPDRKGRHVVFLARILLDFGIEAKGIACDEYTAVCIDTNGIARVFGGYPTYDDNAYFIMPNCELSSVLPENCSLGNPLNWNLGNAALKVYSVKGTANGSNTFDLNNWQTGTGGVWENWYVDNGVLYESPTSQPNCSLLSIPQLNENKVFKIYPNPSTDKISIEFNHLESIPETLKILAPNGQIKKKLTIAKSKKMQLEVSDLPSGVYFIEVSYKDRNNSIDKLIIK